MNNNMEKDINKNVVTFTGRELAAENGITIDQKKKQQLPIRNKTGQENIPNAMNRFP